MKTRRLNFVSRLILALLLVLLPVAETFAQQATSLKQYFGDGSTVTFSTGTIPASSSVQVKVGGVEVPFTWASATTVTLASAPLARTIIDINAVTETATRQQVRTNGLVVGNLFSTGAVSGVPITSILTSAVVYDAASTATLTSPTDGSFTITGAAVNDICVVGLPAAPTAGMIYSCFVSAADTVKLREFNATAGTVDAASATFRLTIIHY